MRNNRREDPSQQMWLESRLNRLKIWPVTISCAGSIKNTAISREIGLLAGAMRDQKTADAKKQKNEIKPKIFEVVIRLVCRQYTQY